MDEINTTLLSWLEVNGNKNLRDAKKQLDRIHQRVVGEEAWKTLHFPGQILAYPRRLTEWLECGGSVDRIKTLTNGMGTLRCDALDLDAPRETHLILDAHGVEPLNEDKHSKMGARAAHSGGINALMELHRCNPWKMEDYFKRTPSPAVYMVVGFAMKHPTYKASMEMLVLATMWGANWEHILEDRNIQREANFSRFEGMLIQAQATAISRLTPETPAERTVSRLRL